MAKDKSNSQIQEKRIKTFKTLKELNGLMSMLEKSPEKWGKAAGPYKRVDQFLKKIDFDNLPLRDETVLKELSSLLSKAGNYNLHSTSTYKQALEYCKHALHLNKAIYGKNHLNVAHSYNNVGLICRRLGESQQELDHLEKALEIFTQALPKNHPDVAHYYDSVAYSCVKLGKYEKSLDHLNKNLEIMLQLPPENRLNVPHTYSNIAYLYAQLGDHKKALDYLQKTLKIYEEKFENSPNSDYAKALKNFALQHKSLGNNLEALKHYKQSFKMFNALENKADFVKDSQDVESEIAILEGSASKLQDSPNPPVSPVYRIPDDHSNEVAPDLEPIGEVKTIEYYTFQE
ncbi:MAG TPA: tetratricopeptide repeat protein [Candidatus Megaira endosymbiont of Nemacystus decipiens]|nr:tetratricopeptide repeat protein [Candidatus Megaera endosymbiont of Nemacystus decipiens]